LPVLDDDVGRPNVAVDGQAEAAAVDDRQAGHPADVRMVDVAVDGDRDAEWAIGLAKLLVGGIVGDDRPAVTWDRVTSATPSPRHCIGWRVSQATRSGPSMSRVRVAASVTKPRVCSGMVCSSARTASVLPRTFGQSSSRTRSTTPIRMRAAERQVTALDDYVWPHLVEVGEDSLEGGQVAVDIGNDRNPHDLRSCRRRVIRAIRVRRP
jgi:hypothetical protein